MKRIFRATFLGIGAYVFMRKIAELGIPLIQSHFITNEDKNFQEIYGKDSYALITGGSKGIGKNIALCLAKRGMNLILVSRDLKNLSEIQNEINKQYPNTKIQIFTHNFGDSPIEIKNKLIPQIKNYDISMLVNNVGTMERTEYNKILPDRVHEMLNVNIGTPAVLTNTMLTNLQKRDKKSAIITVSSVASYYPRPYMTLYDCTKVFDDYLTLGLSEEKSNEKIDFLLVRPGRVNTDMQKGLSKGFDNISAEEQAELIVKQIGVRKIAVSHWKHHIMVWIFSMLPHSAYVAMWKKRMESFKK